jgi:hypothetical protein
MAGITCAALLGANLLFAVPAPAGGSATHAKSKSAKKGGAGSRHSRHAWRARGQKTIDEARAREIQQALIREGYLDGKASGQWDARSKDAMVRYQADHGWQTKTVPDARALIKLGLGPTPAGPVPGESPGAPSATPAGGEKTPASTRQN